MCPSGRFLLGWDRDHHPCLIGSTTGKIEHRFSFTSDSYSEGIALTPDDKVLVDCEDGKHLRLTSVETGKSVECVDIPRDDPDDFCSSLKLSPDGRIAYVPAGHGTILRRDLRVRKWLEPLKGVPAGELYPLPDGKRLLVHTETGLLRRYELEPFRELPLPEGLDPLVRVETSQDGRRIAIADSDSANNRLQVFDGTGRRLWALHPSPYGSYRWSPDGRRLASVGPDRIDLLDADTGKVRSEVRCRPGDLPLSAAFAPDGKRLFAMILGEGLATFDLGTGRQTGLHRLPDWGYWGIVTNWEVMPEGRVLLYHKSRGACLIDPATGRTVVDWTGPDVGLMEFGESIVPKALCHPDGSCVISWKADGSTLVRDPATLAIRRQMPFHTWDEGAISPNGLWLATAGLDGRLRLRDLASGDLLGEWAGHLAMAEGVTFVGPFRAVTSSSYDRTALLWELRPKEKPVLPLWYALAGPWAADAYRAVWAVAADPNGPDFCRKYIPPARPLPADQLNQWLADLGADRFAVREAATRRLEAAGRLAESRLRAERARTTSEEVRTRTDRILSLIPRERTPAELLHARAVAAMELAGTAEAKKLLAEWAAGAPGARLTRDAQAALARLGGP